VTVDLAGTIAPSPAFFPRMSGKLAGVEEGRCAMRYIVLWALGVPVTALIVMHLFGVI